MIYDILMWAFVGGALRAVAGFFHYGYRNVVERLICLGIVGIAGGLAYYSVFGISNPLLLVVPAYVFTDIAKSLHSIASKTRLLI